MNTCLDKSKRILPTSSLHLKKSFTVLSLFRSNVGLSF